MLSGTLLVQKMGQARVLVPPKDETTEMAIQMDFRMDLLTPQRPSVRGTAPERLWGSLLARLWVRR